MVSKLIKGSGRITEADIASLELAVKNQSLGKRQQVLTKASSLPIKSSTPRKTSVRKAQPVEEAKDAESIKNVNEWVLINALNR